MAKRTEVMVDDVAKRPLGEPMETNEDGYVAIKWSEYKELLITKGKYEEIKKKEAPTIEYVPYAPNTSPITTPYPADLTPKYPYTLCKTETHDDAIDSLRAINTKVEVK